MPSTPSRFRADTAHLVLNQGDSYSLSLPVDQMSPYPVKGDPSELARHEIDQIGDLVALGQGLVTGKTAVLSSPPGGNNLHDIRLRRCSPCLIRADINVPIISIFLSSSFTLSNQA